MVTTHETGTLPYPLPFGAGEGRRLRAAAGVQSRWRPALPPEDARSSRADVGKRRDRISSPSASGATSTAPDEREGEEPPTTGPAGDHDGVVAPSSLPAARHAPAAARVWTAWDPSQGTTPRPRNFGRVGASHEAWDGQTALNDLTAALGHWLPTGFTTRWELWPQTSGAACGAGRLSSAHGNGSIPTSSRNCGASSRPCRAHRVASPSCSTTGRRIASSAPALPPRSVILHLVSWALCRCCGSLLGAAVAHLRSGPSCRPDDGRG